MSVSSVCIVLCTILNSILTYIFNNRVTFQNASSSGGDVGVSFLGDDDKVTQFPPNPEYDETNPFTIESDSSFEPLTSSEQQHANLQESHQTLKKTTADRVKGTSASYKERGANLTSSAGIKPPVSVAMSYRSSS